MEGSLEVWHGFFSRWVNYYFRTHEDTLIFGPKKQQIEGKVHLKVAQIISIVDDPISFIIHTGTDTLRLRANSIQERIKWFKKLKKIQKSIEQENYTKEMSSLNQDKNKGNKIKMLESIVLDLWQCHAQLQSQIDDISQRFKSISAVKGLTDKLRMTVQSIKLKNSEALKIIEEYTRSEREKRGATSNRYGSSPAFEENSISQYQQPNGTMFMSFEDKKTKAFKKLSKRESEHEQYKDSPLLMKRSNMSNMQNENSQVTPFKVQSSIKRLSTSRNLNIEHPIKQKLLDSNVVFMQIKKNITDNKTRTVLPERFTPQQKFPIGSVLKGAVGADLTRFALPVTINEPLSMLQKGCEQMYYSKLLDQANEQDKPEKRMLYVVAFLISQYSLSDMRIKKPFNPLLGQTFQYYDQERQFTYVSEQVSHHPPVSAMYCYSDTFQIFDQSKAKTSFTGTSIKIIPEGKSKIKLEKYPEEEYFYDKCTICLNNLVVGKTQLEIVGQITIECPKNNVKSELLFKEQSFFSKSGLNQIEGDIKVNGTKCYTLSGKWNQSVKATETGGDKAVSSVWTRKHICNKDYYYFNEYTMLLNHLNKRNMAEMAPTDSRLRPDQRALQYRKLDLAESEKLRLEEKQRAKRKQNQERKRQHKIKWFNLVKDENGNEVYIINENYENERQRGQWSQYPDLF